MPQQASFLGRPLYLTQFRRNYSLSSKLKIFFLQAIEDGSLEDIEEEMSVKKRKRKKREDDEDDEIGPNGKVAKVKIKLFYFKIVCTTSTVERYFYSLHSSMICTSNHMFLRVIWEKINPRFLTKF